MSSGFGTKDKMILPRRRVLRGDPDGSGFGNFLVQHHRLLTLVVVLLFAGNTIRIGISSLDIGVRHSLPHELQTNPREQQEVLKPVDAVVVVDNDSIDQEHQHQKQEPEFEAATEVSAHKATVNGGISSGAALGLQNFQIPAQPARPLSPPKNVIVLGGAGFIGFHTAIRLHQLQHKVVIYDLMPNHNHDAMMQERLQILQQQYGSTIVQGDICNVTHLYATLKQNDITHVVYLASQDYGRGFNTTAVNETSLDLVLVRPVKEAFAQLPSPSHVFEYPSNNLDCFASLLDIVRSVDLQVVYASSVHGYSFHSDMEDVPHPFSYHVSKRRTNEEMAQSYYHLYGVSTTGIRFPTVYGTYGCPDFRYYQYALAMANNVNTTTVIDIPTINGANKDDPPRELQSSLIHVQDLAKKIVASMDVAPDGAQIARVGRACSMTTSTLVSRLQDAFDQVRNPPSDVVQRRLGEEIDAPVSTNISLNLLNVSHTNYQEMLFQNISKTRCNNMRNGEVPLDVGLYEFVDWLEHQGKMLSPPMEKPEQEQGQDQASVLTSKLSPAVPDATDYCHVTASFALDVDQADKVPSVAHLSHDAPNRYFFFTNLPDLPCEGWERVLMKDMPFRRFITQSRWPKFMGWKHPALASCKVIWYADAFWRPKQLPQSVWDGLARQAMENSAGIVQQIRPFKHTAMKELKFIKGHRKDIRSNVEATRTWLLNQPDFNNTSISYRNNAFVYDPNNDNFRELMTAFWTHYSQEEDSWRDQPLYRYLVNKLDLTPALYLKGTGRKGIVRDYWEEKGEKGHNGHHYKERDDHVNEGSQKTTTIPDEDEISFDFGSED